MKKYHLMRILGTIVGVGFMAPFYYLFPIAAAIVTMFIMFLMGFAFVLAIIFTWDWEAP